MLPAHQGFGHWETARGDSGPEALSCHQISQCPGLELHRMRIPVANANTNKLLSFYRNGGMLTTVAFLMIRSIWAVILVFFLIFN